MGTAHAARATHATHHAGKVHAAHAAHTYVQNRNGLNSIASRQNERRIGGTCRVKMRRTQG